MNPPLKLLPYPPTTAYNNLTPIICYKNIIDVAFFFIVYERPTPNSLESITSIYALFYFFPHMTQAHVRLMGKLKECAILYMANAIPIFGN